VDAHWLSWLEMKLPTFADRTPMEAVPEIDGRAMVITPLDAMERREPSQTSGLKQQNNMEPARA